MKKRSVVWPILTAVALYFGAFLCYMQAAEGGEFHWHGRHFQFHSCPDSFYFQRPYNYRYYGYYPQYRQPIRPNDNPIRRYGDGVWRNYQPYWSR